MNEVNEALDKAYNLEVKNLGHFAIPEDLVSQQRGQYLGSHIIDQLKGRRDGFHMILAIVDLDLFAPGLNFIFGQADSVEQIAVVSTHRLKGERFIPRLRTEVIHEIGHLLGLGHCFSTACVMFFSNTVYDTDHKGENFCFLCQRKLNGRL